MGLTNGMIGTDHPDAVTYRRAADAFRAQDLQTLSTTIDADVRWHVPGTSWFSREVDGRSAVVAYLREIMQRTNGTFTLEDVHVSGSDDHVVTVQRFGATLGEETKVFDVTSVLRFADGLQAERWFHYHDQRGFDAFMSRF